MLEKKTTSLKYKVFKKRNTFAASFVDPPGYMRKDIESKKQQDQNPRGKNNNHQLLFLVVQVKLLKL